MNFLQKYLKYKNKYNNIKQQYNTNNQQGGAVNDEADEYDEDQDQETCYAQLLSVQSTERSYEESVAILRRNPQTYMNDIEFMTRVIDLDYRLYDLASNDLIRNRQFIDKMNQKLMTLINHDIYNITERTDPDNLLPSLSYMLHIGFDNSDIWYTALASLLLANPETLQYMPSNIISNIRLIKHIRDTPIAIEVSGTETVYKFSKRFKILNYIPDELNNNPEFAEENKNFALQIAHDAYLSILNTPDNYYRFDNILDSNYPLLSNKLMLDRDVVLAFLKVDGNNFRHIIDPNLKNDKEIVLTALYYGLDISILFDDYENCESNEYRRQNYIGLTGTGTGHHRKPTEADERSIIDSSGRDVRKFKYIILAGLKSISRKVENVSSMERRLLGIESTPLHLRQIEQVKDMRFRQLMDLKELCSNTNIIKEAMKIWLQEKHLISELNPKIIRKYTIINRRTEYRIGEDFPLRLWLESIREMDLYNRDVLNFILTLVQNNPLLLHFIIELKIFDIFYEYNSYDIMEIFDIAVTRNGLTLAFIEPGRTLGETLEGNNQYTYKSFVMKAVQQNGLAIQYVRGHQNHEIILMAVQQNGLALKHVHEYLIGDNEVASKIQIIGEAVRQNGLALEFANYRDKGTHHTLNDNEELVRTALICHQPGNFIINNGNGLALKFASTRLQNNREFVKEAVNCNGLALEFASTILQNDLEIVNIARRNNQGAIRYASQYLQDTLQRA